MAEERDIVVNVIQQWNDLNSAERRIVLLPVRWETHSAPEYGKRPQEVINRQIVDNCDLLLGIFWTRVGSPTGVADSGTIEEIERIAGQGKLVMLYFSSVKKNPDEVDPDQLKRLREFKQKVSKNALIESFSSQIELRDKLQKQIEIQIRSLLSAQNASKDDDDKHKLDICLEFANPELNTRLGNEITLKSVLVHVPDFETIPDYEEEGETSLTAGAGNLFLSEVVNPNYYREKIYQAIQQQLFVPIKFWLKNEGTIGARDVYVEISISTEDGKISVLSPESLLSEPRNVKVPLYQTLTDPGVLARPTIGLPGQLLSDSSNAWDTIIELPALQPKREIVPTNKFLIGAEKTTKILFNARIFADTLPEPIARKLTVTLEVERIEAGAAALVNALKKKISKES